ncbi:hypothetical protein AVEN_264337-1 [Araneus ventricosus]|uniref:Uncharacterized protein n=1 Tax=Araneus ventricosus TaxID=182803 RepID=A0A4Y2H5S1_ARAVE|nr:hypothetical protein AVEN_264337-1 [Araneus ventricosus]
MEEPVTSSDEEQESGDACIFCNDLYSNSKDRGEKVFALSNTIPDPYELMYKHAHLSNGCDGRPTKITNEHENDHDEHMDNSKTLEHLSDKKRIAKNAVESVFAKLLMQSRR